MNTRAIGSPLWRRITRGSSQPVRVCASRPYSKEGGLLLNRRSPVLIFAVWAVSALTITFISTQPAHALLVYSNDFEGGLGSEWSSTSVETTPLGSRNFLGQFDNNTVSLTLPLPAHTDVTVSFDLYILQSWDGNDTNFGPDIWELIVDGAPTLLHTTFSNAFASEPAFRQAYPDAFPGGDHPGLTGTAESDTLGYANVAGYDGASDSVYQLSFTFVHSASAVVLNFAGTGLEGIGDESWGLDNVRIDVTPIAEPNTFFLCGTGLAGYGVMRRWRRKRNARNSGRSAGTNVPNFSTAV